MRNTREQAQEHESRGDTGWKQDTSENTVEQQKEQENRQRQEVKSEVTQEDVSYKIIPVMMKLIIWSMREWEGRGQQELTLTQAKEHNASLYVVQNPEFKIQAKKWLQIQ